jgi:tetratricopeptide (TPR) repeat protein
MKKIIYIVSVAVTFTLGSCDVLDQEPYTSLEAETAITNPAAAQGALLGLYDGLQDNDYYGRLYQVYGDLPADLVDHTGTFPTLLEIHNNTISPSNITMTNTWLDIYDVVNRANEILAQVPDVSGLAPEEKDAILGQAHFVRGLAFFDLLRLWGKFADQSSEYGIPLRLEPTRAEDLGGEGASRASVAATYTQIISDLDEAVELMGETASANAGYASGLAAKALLARVYLYKGDYDLALQNANDVITSGAYSLEPSFNDLFEGNPSNEFIFVLKFNAQDANSQAFHYFPSAFGGRREYAPSAAYEAMVSTEGDLRAQGSLGYTSNEQRFGTKYREISTGSDPAFIIRYAEVLLIAAEAAARQGDLAAAVEYLNLVRERAGLEGFEESDFASTNAFVDAVIEEKAKEFAMEGVRWFDLVRTNKLNEVLGIDNNLTTFPIPQRERDVNPNIAQNPEYQG